jgi:hypothetical protein
MHLLPPTPLTARRRHILHAMGVNVYRRPSAAPAPEAQLDPTPVELAIPGRTAFQIPSAPLPPVNHQRPEKLLPIKKPSTPRMRAGSTEWALPEADLAWFLRSKMKLHLQLTLKQADIVAAANSDASDTALYFDRPETALLKVGGIARLRTQWRAKRDAWLALRMWRKTIRGG